MADGTAHVRIARSLEDVERLRGPWEALQATPASDLGLYRALLRSLGEPVRPHVISIARDGVPVMLAVGRLQDVNLRCPVGYRVVARPRLRALVFPPGSIVGDRCSDAAPLLATSLSASLASGEAEVAIFQEVPFVSALTRAMRNAGGVVRRDHFPDRNLRWSFALPESYEAFLRARSAAMRKSLRHAANRLRRAYGDTVVVRRYVEPGDLEEFLETVERIAARTYQRAIGVGFFDTPVTRTWIAHAMLRGWFRGYVLSVDGVPAAFAYGLCYRGTYHAGDTGYDPQFRAGVGDYLLNREIEDLCRDGEAREFDFGLGDAAYKRRYGDRVREEATVHLFAPTWRAVRCNAVRSAVALLNEALKRAARGLRLFERVRRRARARAVSKPRVER